MNLDELSKELTRLVAEVAIQFQAIAPSAWISSRGEGAWTRLEILGHLLDSASNNHQRFARAIAEGSLIWPGYDQNAMVRVHRYRDAEPAELIELWRSYNLFLARLIGLTPAGRADALCTIGGDAPVTLAFLMTDYVRHMEHHLRQILDNG